jgi:hypothetical protein
MIRLHGERGKRIIRGYRRCLLVASTAALLLFLAGQVLPAEGFHVPAVPDGAERICISLKVLSRVAVSLQKESKRLPERYAVLDGLAYIEGYVVDERNGDVILIGLRSPMRPPLTLDDLIVNMRCIAQSLEYPYCSLEPLKENTKAVQALFVSASGIQTPEAMKKLFREVKAAVGPQRVVIGGIPRNSNHAHIMVEADYHMKKVSQGLIAVPHVISVVDRSLNEGKNDILRNRRGTSMKASMSRFWFHIGADEPTFKEGKGIVWLDRCSVVVLTEKQAATASGRLYDVAEEDPMGIAFAGDMSEHFSELTGEVPIYAELENIFRLRALLLALDFRGSLDAAGFTFDSYIRDYEYRYTEDMKPTYPGLANYREWSHEEDRGDVLEMYYLFPIVCGGVGMDMEVTDERFDDRNSGKWNSVRDVALMSRPSDRALAWVFKID